MPMSFVSKNPNYTGKQEQEEKEVHEQVEDDKSALTIQFTQTCTLHKDADDVVGKIQYSFFA